tara:strand:+ start:1341 stop:2174 length:834 start_codon:yes stop_codon:yes gene_type:complete
VEAKDIYKKYAKGNKDAPLKIISLGLGVQSTAVYLMSSMGYKLPRADYAVFADPGAEHPKTYKILEWLLEWKENNNGIDIITNKDRNLYEDIINKIPKGERVASIPAFSKNNDGLLMRQCTSEYKIQPVIKTARSLHNLKPRQRMLETEMWLGISLDEIERMKESNLYNIKYFYPLVYHVLSRNDCIDFFKDNNFPIPVKSSCVFCPYHSNKFWKEMKSDQNVWDDIIKVDKTIRNNKRLKESQYLHRSCTPINEVDFEDNQLEMFEGYDCEGYCGL